VTTVDNSKRALRGFLSEWLKLDASDNISLVGSGRTAICLGLSALSRLDRKRKVVVIPSYACQALLNAVLAANLVPKFIDTTDTLISAPEQYLEAATADVLCVILVGLCGKRMLLDGRKEILSTLRDRGVFAIDDNCQDFTAVDAQARADMECYSLGFSKTLRATAGGLLAARIGSSEIADLLSSYSRQPTGDSQNRVKYYDHAYGGERRDLDPGLLESFRNSRSEYGNVLMSDLDQHLAASQAGKLGDIMRLVSDNSHEIIRTIDRFPEVYRHQGTACNSFTRLPVILQDEEGAAKFWSYMNAQGIELEGMYSPLHLAYGNGEHLPAAERLSKLVYNVPNRSDLSKSETRRIVSALQKFGKAARC
jgi:dTDP-4-amino-4,6-dideoxygalactose transaminase